MNKEMREVIAAYVRVSTTGQNEEGQRREIEKWLNGNGHAGVRWYVDKRTGDNLDRPAFAQLQRDLFNGDIDAVVIWKLDRLSRSIIDGVTTLAKWCERGVRVVSVTQQLDFNGAMGKMLAAVFFGVAEMEQETRRERQRVGIEAAKARGVYRGRQVGTMKGDPNRAVQLRQQGLTLPEIARALGVSSRTAARYVANECKRGS
jgi:DNA invertase Pin-like site-specific DNA recombinase